MLGDKIGETRGKTTGMRVVPGSDPRYVKMEVTIQEAGTLYGTQANNMGTYLVFERVPGQLYGEGQGIAMTADGESAIWNGHGIGKPTGRGMGMTIRFSVAYQASGTGKLAKLNNLLVIGEHTVDENGNTHTQQWEWK